MLRELLRKKSVMAMIAIVLVVFIGVPAVSYAVADAPEQGTDKFVCKYTATYNPDSQSSINLDVSQVDGSVPRESFWSYLGDFWSFDTGEVYRVDDPQFAVTVSVLFTDSEGAKTWLFQETREYAELEGVVESAFECAMVDSPGTYTISVTMLEKGVTGSWNTTIAWDKEIVTVK